MIHSGIDPTSYRSQSLCLTTRPMRQEFNKKINFRYVWVTFLSGLNSSKFCVKIYVFQMNFDISFTHLLSIFAQIIISLCFTTSSFEPYEMDLVEPDESVMSAFGPLTEK